MSMKGDRLYYLLAVLVFVVGGLDFAAYTAQKHDNFTDVLSDSFAITGIGLWWLLALMLVALPTIRKRKAGQESEAEAASQE